MSKVFVLAGLRTPTGVFDGKLKGFSEQQLCATAMKELLGRSGMPAAKIDEIIVGCAKQTSVPSNLARHASLIAGIPDEVPAYTVQRQSASGLQALANGYWSIKSGMAKVVMAGGVESTSNIPGEIHDARFRFDKNTKIVFDPFAAQFAGAQPVEAYGELCAKDVSQKIADLYGLSQGDLADYAKSSVEKAKGESSGSHLIPIEVVAKKATEIFDRDELYGEPGAVAGLADGAALCILAGEQAAAGLGLPIQGELLSVAVSAGDPAGKGWVGEEAVAKALRKAGIAAGDVGLVECGEIFASQSLALLRELDKMGIKNARDIFNVAGGALAKGNPWGACGAVVFVDLLELMKAREAQIGIAVMPAEGGQVMAAILRRQKSYGN